MHALKGYVEGGHLVLNEPTEIPEGTVVRLVAIDMSDDLDDCERAWLHAALDEGLEELDGGERIAAHEVLASLRKR